MIIVMLTRAQAEALVELAHRMEYPPPTIVEARTVLQAALKRTAVCPTCGQGIK